MALNTLKANQIILFRHLISNCLKLNKTSVFYSYSTLNVDQKDNSYKDIIKIPKRIERGPTDILKALAEITQRDMTAPDYRYIDDPFLTPLSNKEKRVFALSRESGRRAAKYIFEEFPEYFFRDNAEPKIEAFTYRDEFDDMTEVDESDLQKCIARKEVNHSIVCYKNLMRDSKPISSESLHKLLELVCFYNCDEPMDMDFIIEKIYKKRSEMSRNLWKDNGFAEQLFSAIEVKTSETYCALIQGMAKYSQSQKAFQYYLEMSEKGFKLNTETINSLLGLAPMLRESSESRWLYIEELFNYMKSNGIKPNLHTLNNTLEVITRFGTMRYSQSLAKKVLVEMTTKLGVEPSLATYYHLLNIFIRDRGPDSSLLYEIIEIIENKEFVVRDTKDVQFFVSAMSVCQTRYSDIQLAYRIHQLVLNPKNNKLLGNALSQSTYYQKFFRILSKGEEIKLFMDIFTKYVPHVYIPEPIVITDILKMISLYESYDYVLRIWDHFKDFEYITNIKLMEELFYLISKAKVDPELQKQFSRIVTKGIKTIDNRMEQQLKEGHFMLNQFSGHLLGFAIEVYLNDNDIENAAKIVDIMTKEKNKVIGNPSPETFYRLIISAIDKKMYSFGKHCIKFCIELAMFEVSDRVLQYVRQSDLDSTMKDLFEKVCNVTELRPESEVNSSLDEDMNK